ncbi:hypothetical protein BKA56DRAFT_486084, partial [Ilyonectria sp. MPI-CAGE-AT-0026]
LLLLICGDTVRKAIAQLIGYKLRLPGQFSRSSGVSISPVAFSFGWVAFGFSILLSAVGEMKLMLDNNSRVMVVNCSNGFAKQVSSWALGRLFRDHQSNHEVDPRPKEEGGRAESIRIDIFKLGPGPASRPTCDFVWWLGWSVVLLQLLISVVPWVLYGDWGVMFVTLGGNLLAAITCAMPQWIEEKWAARPLGRDKVTCLTSGNGGLHIMVFIGGQDSWDLEALATGTINPRRETRWITSALTALWCCLLVTVSGLQEHSWFLVGIGAIGMVQNAFAAGTPRSPGASNFHYTKFERAPTIIGVREYYKDDSDASVDMKGDLDQLVNFISPSKSEDAMAESFYAPTAPKWTDSMSKEDGAPDWLDAIPKKNGIIHAVGVHGALMELEKWVPTAGLAMVQMFFPIGLRYMDESIRDNIHKKFWKRAYHTQLVRRKAEEKRRAAETRMMAPSQGP